MSGGNLPLHHPAMKNPDASRESAAGGPWQSIIVGLLVACCLLPVLMKPAEFMQDDSYFYLQVAHNIAQGEGSTFSLLFPIEDE